MAEDRLAIIRSMLNASGKGLEIGPSHNPVFPKREGYDVEIFDFDDADGLRRRLAGQGVDIDRIEEVDHIFDGRPIHETIGKSECYDFIFSSHVIEHVPDFIAYFQSCERLLKPDGLAVLVIPDKRFVFDVFQNPTTTGDILGAHADARQKHPASRLFDWIANRAHMEGRETWSVDDDGDVSLRFSLHHAHRSYTSAGAPDAGYVDFHTWFFTPSSFRLVMHDLHGIGATRLREVSMIHNDTLEFYVALSRSGYGCPKSRVDLLHELQREQAISALQVLNRHVPDTRHWIEKLRGATLQETVHQPLFAIDRKTFADGIVEAKGWCEAFRPESPIRLLRGEEAIELEVRAMDRPDVEDAHGHGGRQWGFAAVARNVAAGEPLVLQFGDGTRIPLFDSVVV